MHPLNIAALSSSLVALGFPPTVEMQLHCHVCFSPFQFELPFVMLSGEDQCVFSVRVERDERGVYQLKYYTATLRKRVEVGAELAGLERRMGVVDWVAVAMGRQVVQTVEEAVIREAAAALSALQDAGIAADILRYKYWQGTPLESLVLFSSQHKAAWEITERFYFFPEMEPISFSDAIRFLNSRWMERQMNVKKKQAERSSEAERGDSGRGLLIKKKPRAGVKRNLLKK